MFSWAERMWQQISVLVISRHGLQKIILRPNGMEGTYFKMMKKRGRDSS